MCKFSFFLLILLFALPLSAAAVPTVAPPPGWQMESRNSYSAENLYGYIDGGAELFLEFGFKELKTVHLTRGKAQLSVEMYQMTEIMSALGIYLAKCSPETPMDGVVPRNSGDRYQLAVVRGCWFIFINNFDGNRSHLQQMRQLANQLAAQIPDKLMAWPCPLDRKRLVKGSVRLARGPVALQSVYTLGEGDILQLNRQNWAMVADYRSKGKTETLVLAVYADEPFARKVFSSLLKNLDPYLKVIRSNETAFIFQDYAGEYGIASIHGRILDIRLHVISVPEM